jgi:predicted peptidase
MDSDINISGEENVEAGTDFTGISMEDLKNLTPGSYTEHSYIGSNGKEVKYWIYVPENINDVEGLPVTAYMCGGCERGNNCNNNSLPLYVKNGTLKPEGIVVTFRAEENSDYTSAPYLNTCKEILDNVVTTYKADTNRISISGHSNGGKGVLALTARYPDYFSVCVPVCGFSNGLKTALDSGSSDEAINNLTKTHIVAVTGNNDANSKTSMNNLLQLVKGSGNMSLEILKGYSHTDTYHKYYEPVEIEGKQYNNLLEYLYSCTKA